MKRTIWNIQTKGALSIIGALFLSQQNPAQSLFSRKKQAPQQSEQPQVTKTFIWGNGIYQPRPDATLKFSNFEPKLIKNFHGSLSGFSLKQISFGEHHEAAIDQNGGLHVWPKQQLEANFANPETDNSRAGVIHLDENNKNYVQVGFTNGFLWALNNKGEVAQWAIKKDLDQRKQVISVSIDAAAKRVVKSLPAGIKQIALGHDHLLALTPEGQVYSMGDDTYGQCGLGGLQRSSAPPYTDRRVKNPRLIEGIATKVTKIACGSNHSLAITEEGKLYGWGSNSRMQLSQEEQFSRSDEPVMSVYTPLAITKNIEKNIVTDVAAGEEHTIIVTENEYTNETEVFACGHNNKGELGAGFMRHISDVTKIESLSNFQVKDASGKQENVRVTKIACGNTHCIALLSAGVVAEWGENDCGQLGNKKRAFSEHPIMVSGFKKENVLNIGAGWTSSAVIVEDRVSTDSKPATTSP